MAPHVPAPMGVVRVYSRNPNRLMFTPVPTTPQSEEAPDNPFREISGNNRSSGEDQYLPPYR